MVLAACASQTAAHADPNDPHHGAPKLAGARRFLSELKGKRKWERRSQASQGTGIKEVRDEQDLEERGELDSRQNTSGKCGAGRGTCAAGYCCSYEGSVPPSSLIRYLSHILTLPSWCGNDEDYCTAPDCQINYGPGCDGNQKPSGVDTSTIARPKLGKIQYGGVGIYDCVNSGDIAVTFDDGPWEYTNDLLDKLAVCYTADSRSGTKLT